VKVVLGAALVALLFVPLASHGASGPPCTYLELEKYEFDSVAKIKARHDCGGSPVLKVVVSDGSMRDASGKKFLERQLAIDKVEEITFTPPAGQHRFLATLMFPDGSGDIDSAYFVTKKGQANLSPRT
jgi:hypothetical protein